MQKLTCGMAIGAQTQRIRYQCLLPFKIGNNIYNLIFLVISRLVVDLILGVETLYDLRADIHFPDRCVYINHDNMQYSIPFNCIELVREEHHDDDILDEKIFIEIVKIKDYLCNPRSVVDNDSIVSVLSSVVSTPSLNKLTVLHSDIEAECENKVMKTPESDVNVSTLVSKVPPRKQDLSQTRELLRKKCSQAYDLTENQRQRLMKTLEKNINVFRSEIGRRRNYVHSLTMSDATPFTHKSRIISVNV